MSIHGNVIVDEKSAANWLRACHTWLLARPKPIDVVAFTDYLASKGATSKQATFTVATMEAFGMATVSKDGTVVALPAPATGSMQ